MVLSNDYPSFSVLMSVYKRDNRKQSVSTRLEFVIESSYAGITSKGGYFL